MKTNYYSNWLVGQYFYCPKDIKSGSTISIQLLAGAFVIKPLHPLMHNTCFCVKGITDGRRRTRRIRLSGDLYGNRFTIVPIVGQEGEGMGRRNNVGNSRSLQDNMELSLHGYILIIFISNSFSLSLSNGSLTHFKLCNGKISETGN